MMSFSYLTQKSVARYKHSHVNRKKTTSYVFLIIIIKNITIQLYINHLPCLYQV